MDRVTNQEVGERRKEGKRFGEDSSTALSSPCLRFNWVRFGRERMGEKGTQE